MPRALGDRTYGGNASFSGGTAPTLYPQTLDQVPTQYAIPLTEIRDQPQLEDRKFPTGAIKPSEFKRTRSFRNHVPRTGTCDG